ncbi:hypothetical protein GBF38_014761 [Nibea albiflora]|uniref:Uncharacterized protein n=1 Tax=Nibea albiflora TaxID=240163 RepID=A0ACB7EJK1_NIBAL|nr:hypothetical protein GBF38_014761 [Nibea albiflora]
MPSDILREEACGKAERIAGIPEEPHLLSTPARLSLQPYFAVSPISPCLTPNKTIPPSPPVIPPTPPPSPVTPVQSPVLPPTPPPSPVTPVQPPVLPPVPRAPVRIPVRVTVHAPERAPESAPAPTPAHTPAPTPARGSARPYPILHPRVSSKALKVSLRNAARTVRRLRIQKIARHLKFLRASKVTRNLFEDVNGTLQSPATLGEQRSVRNEATPIAATPAAPAAPALAVRVSAAAAAATALSTTAAEGPSVAFAAAAAALATTPAGGAETATVADLESLKIFSQTKKKKVVMRVKGITQTGECVERVNFDSITDLVEGYLQGSREGVIETPQHNIGRDKKGFVLKN